jgi:DNA repair exonuclease SbcCD nuclease subunit
MSEGEDDVVLKLLHTADWHLGRRFGGFKEADQPKLTRARLDVVERILNVAESERVDAVLCAGDLFDEPDPHRDWWEGLANMVKKRAWQGRPVFLLPGNHDPLTSTSVYSPSHPFRAALPPWVQVVDRDDFEVELGPEAVIYACPCRSTAGEMDLALRLPSRAPGDERIRVGMVHGTTFDIPGYQVNFPIAKDAAVQRGLDYLAIGDTHAYRRVPPDGSVPTVYPSAPEQTTFGETDTGYVVLALFPRRRRSPILREQRVANWTWRTETIRSVEALRELRDAQDLRRTVLRLVIDMKVPAAQYDEAEKILRDLEGTDAVHGRVGVIQIDRDALELDTHGIEVVFEALPPVVQAAARKLKEDESLPEKRETAQRALYHLFRLARGGALG